MLLKKPKRFNWPVFTRLGALATRWPVLVIALWLIVPAALLFATPSLSDVVRDHPVELVPASAPAMVTEQQMAEAFHESGGENLMLIVLTNDGGLTPADENVYRTLITALKADGKDVKMLQEFINTPAMREIVTSEDGKAWIIPVGLTGGLDTPEGGDAYKRVSEIVHRITDGTSLKVGITGPSGTIADLTEVGDADMHLIEIATLVLVLGILAMVYRRPVTMMLPLVTIGLTLLTARGVVAGLSEIGLGVSNETVILMTAMVAGAGTDYAVFLISRYHEELRRGVDSDTAVVMAMGAVGNVIAASAATVAITFLCMSFAKLGLLSTVGPALAITVAIAMAAAFTLLPAVLTLAGRRGWVSPRRELTTKMWHNFGVRLVRRPAKYLIVSLVVLGILATAGLFVRFDWDESKSLPDNVPSNQGYTMLAAHFPLNSTIPQYIVITSPNDLRNPVALADLERLAFRLTQIPGVQVVRGITRPNGQPPEQATVAWQAGEVGSRLQRVVDEIHNSKGDLDRLVNGARELAAALAELRHQVNSSGVNDPALRQSLATLSQLANDGTLHELSSMANDLPPSPETQEIIATVDGVRAALSSAVDGLHQVETLGTGAEQLATASRQLSDGVQKLVDSVNRMASGIQEAATFLATLKNDAGANSSTGGFFLPTHALSDTDLREAAAVFISPDGHTVRYLFQTSANPFGTDAMDLVDRVLTIAHAAQPNTTLEDAQISVSGFPSVNHDLREYYNHDLRFVMLVTLAVVFLILVLLLRAIIAPLHLIASVVISYLSALGVGVLLFQVVLGQELSWNVPGMAFIVLVAVGADYNMLLISRVREESSHDVSAGMIKTIGTTGGVITSAGLIFAASMFGLLFGSVTGMVQSGFIIGVGLLIDTFLVRTVTVPALTVLIGRVNWWPTLWGRRTIPLSVEDETKLSEIEETEFSEIEEIEFSEIEEIEWAIQLSVEDETKLSEIEQIEFSEIGDVPDELLVGGLR
jgi:putative drug exporter of the RND superfamily